jgi:hypothetical protein
MFRTLVTAVLLLTTVSAASSQTKGGTIDFDRARPTVMPKFDGRIIPDAQAPKTEESKPGYSIGSTGNGNTKPLIVAPAPK